MKLLIGIMYCIENEFEQCIESIKKQTHKSYEYFVIEKMPNKAAHDQLYFTFMSNAYKYDLFIKIDADMVLARDTFFTEVIDYFTKYPETDDLQIAVHDFFTNRLIYGLHVYSNRMQWQKNEENIFVDWSEERLTYTRVNDKVYLAPAAHHCPNPSKFQAFHFGLHKAVKITQYDRQKLRDFACFVHWDNALELMKHFQINNHIALAFAIIGLYEGITQKLTPEYVNFDNHSTKKLFIRWDSFGNEENILRAKQITQSLLSLPYNLQLQIILFKRNIHNTYLLFAMYYFIKNILLNRLAKYRMKK